MFTDKLCQFFRKVLWQNTSRWLFLVPTFSSRVSAEQNLHKSIIMIKFRYKHCWKKSNWMYTCKSSFRNLFFFFSKSSQVYQKPKESKKCCHGRVGVWVIGAKYSKMDQVKFVEDILDKCVVCWGRPYHFKFFKGCLPHFTRSILEYSVPNVFAFSEYNVIIILTYKIKLKLFLSQRIFFQMSVLFFAKASFLTSEFWKTIAVP